MEKTNHRLLKSPQRSSKISMALKNSFISTILEEGMSIKKAAAKYRLNYSTAKVIYQRYRAQKIAEERRAQGLSEESQSKQDAAQKQKRLQEQQKYRCSYKQLSNSDSASGSQSTNPPKHDKIIIVSTVAWDFLKDGLPSFQ